MLTAETYLGADRRRILPALRPDAKEGRAFRMGGEMIGMFYRAAALAVLIAVAALPARAQDSGDYKPPARLIAREDPTPSGLGAAPQGAVAGPARKTIGVISTVGDAFNVKTVGMTVFGNEENKFPIPSWKVNDRVTASVANLLKKNFKVKRIPAQEAAFASLDAPGRLFRSYDDDLLEIVRKLSAAHPADYYLVVTPSGSPFGSSNQVLRGLGVTRTDGGLLGLGAGDYVHALTALRVYDGQFKLLRTESGTIGQETFLATVKGPHQLLEDDKRLPKEAQAVAKDPRAKQIALDLLDKSLATTVTKIFAKD
jgi:hypothetical protein